MLSTDEIKVKNKLIDLELPIILFSRCSKEGIASASILAKTLQRLNKNFSLIFFNNLDDNKLTELKTHRSEQVVILDPLETEKIHNYLYLFRTEKTVSEKCFEVAKSIDSKNIDLIYLTLISLENVNNKSLIEETENSGKVKRIKGLKILGSNTRPINKTIELSIDPFIVSFSGSEENSINLFKDSGISLKTAESWTCLMDLNELQIEKLITSLSLNQYPIDELYETRFILTDEKRNSPFKDVHEFSLFLEACINCKKPSIAVAKCLNSISFTNRSLELLKDYRQDIIKALSLFYISKDDSIIKEKENCIIINYKNLVSENILHKVVDLIQNSKIYEKKKRIVAICQTQLEELKCVISFFDNKSDANIKNLISSLPGEIKVENLENCIILNSSLDLENKILELILEHIESVRIEEIN
ncbi:MAG TPA: hypothetical protein VJI68_00395 [Candidatus Nanoarchaeia archaeon]|nr:hypothetical protein [Candidatus Nanoarchaeia archaeon]